MKKRNLILSTLLSTLGVAAGFLYVRESNRRKQNGNGNGASGDAGNESELFANPQAQTAERPEASNSTSNSRSAAGRAASMGRIENGNADLSEHEAQGVIDDQGTDQIEAAQILKEIRDTAFDASDEKLALALGRPTEEIEEWTNGSGIIDGDVIMKARALAMQRGLEVE